MLSCVLTVITCTAIPVADPLEIPATMPADQPTVDVGTFVTSTSIRSRNYSSNDCLLLFGNAASASPVIVILPPGASVEYEFSPQDLRDVSFEVVSWNGSTMATSGAVPLALPPNATDQSLWNVTGPPGLLTWQQNGAEVSLLAPAGSMVPAGWGAVGPDPNSCAAAAQTPIAVPTRRIPSGVDAESYLPM